MPQHCHCDPEVLEVLKKFEWEPTLDSQVIKPWHCHWDPRSKSWRVWTYSSENLSLIYTLLKPGPQNNRPQTKPSSGILRQGKENTEPPLVQGTSWMMNQPPRKIPTHFHHISLVINEVIHFPWLLMSFFCKIRTLLSGRQRKTK